MEILVSNVESVAIQIFSYLKPKDLANSRSVCKDWQILIDSLKIWWCPQIKKYRKRLSRNWRKDLDVFIRKRSTEDVRILVKFFQMYFGTPSKLDEVLPPCHCCRHKNQKLDKFTNPLRFAIYKGLTDEVELLLTSFHNSHVNNDDGGTAFIWACKTGCYRIVKLFLKGSIKAKVRLSVMFIYV